MVLGVDEVLEEEVEGPVGNNCCSRVLHTYKNDKTMIDIDYDILCLARTITICIIILIRGGKSI